MKVNKERSLGPYWTADSCQIMMDRMMNFPVIGDMIQRKAYTTGKKRVVTQKLCLSTHFGFKSDVDVLDHSIHLQQLGSYQGTHGALQVANVVQAKVVQNQHIPLIRGKHPGEVSCHIMVHLRQRLITLLFWDEARPWPHLLILCAHTHACTHARMAVPLQRLHSSILLVINKLTTNTNN